MDKYKGLGRGGLARAYMKANPRLFQKPRVYKRRKPRVTKQIVDKENKFFDTTVSANMRTTGQIHSSSINLIPQGTTQSTRVGRRIVINSISMKGTITIPTTVISGLNYQIALVLDKQANKANAAYTDIYTSNAFNSFLNLANSGRFIVLKVFRSQLNPSTILTSTTSLPTLKTIKMYKKCNIPIEFTADTGAITEITSNNLAWYVIINGTDDATVLAMTTRVRYVG